MAQITVNINDNYLNDVLDAFAQQFNYDQRKEANETKAQFAKRMVMSHMKKIVENYLAIKGAELARIEASKDVNLMIE